jgi:hypothetical protein
MANDDKMYVIVINELDGTEIETTVFEHEEGAIKYLKEKYETMIWKDDDLTKSEEREMETLLDNCKTLDDLVTFAKESIFECYYGLLSSMNMDLGVPSWSKQYVFKNHDRIKNNF